MLLVTLMGGFFAVHCYRAGLKELRTGIAKGRFRDYPRGHPGFWPVIFMTFAASVMGMVFFAYGLAELVLGLE